MATQNETQRIYNTDQAVSVNVYFDADIGGETKTLQISARHGASAEDIKTRVVAVIEGYKAARELYPRPAGKPVANAEAKPVTENSGEKKKFEQVPVPAGDKPEGLPEGIECFKDEFDYFEITPQSDNKATVAFYKDKLQFPIGARINKWKNANVAQALAPLGDFDVTKASKPRVAGVMYWSKGSEYIIATGAHKGEASHYKDLRLIQAAL